MLLGLGHSLAEQVRLSDFGVAAAVGGGTPLSRVACGTPGYMAPEQFLARWRDQGPWTDLYALGCLATELVQGTPPFTATTIQELMRRHLTEEPPALDPSVAVPPGFEAWLQRLLEKRPRGRFQRAAEAAESLKSLGEPVLRARREPALRQYPDTVSESTLFLEEWLPQDAPPPPDVGVTPLQVALPPCPEAAPEDAWPRATLTQAGLSLFGLRVLPLVGRTAERQVLWRSLRQAVRTRRPYGVVLHGPQGIGRSRLASWIGEHAHATAAGTVVTVRHAPGGAPAAGLRSLFCDWLGLRELAGQDLAGRLADVRPGGAQLTPLEQEDLRELLEGTRDRTARDRRHLRTLATRLLGAEAGRRPVVLILDDVQWADDTLAIATALLRAAAPILLVLTARDDGQATSAALTRRLTAFSGHPSVSLLPLGPLGPEAMEALVRELLHLGPELGGQLLARAGGHPAFAVQLVADWLARGLLQTVDGALALRVGVEATVPEGLQAAWMLPVARLTQDHGDEGRDALELAAVLGQRVDDAEWLGACEAAGCPVPEALLDALLDERLVRREGAGWTFAHAPFRECLVQAAHQGGRSPRWHRACAQALAAAGGPLGRQGHHLLAGGQPGAAFEALVQALALAPADLAPELVSRLHDQALRALDEAGVASTDPRRSRLAEVRGRHRG